MTDVAFNTDKSNAPVLIAVTARKNWGYSPVYSTDITIYSVCPGPSCLGADGAHQQHSTLHLACPTLVLKTLWDNLSSPMVSWL